MAYQRPLPPDDAATLTPLMAHRLHIALVVVSLIALALLLWIARGALAPFVFGAILAYLLLPAVRKLERFMSRVKGVARFRRPFAVVAVYVIVIATIVVLVRVVVPPLAGQVLNLADAFPDLVSQGRERISQVFVQYHAAVPDELEAAIDANLAEAGSAASGWLRAGATATLSWLARTVAGIIGFLIVPIWVFYVLKDREHGASLFYRLFPERVRPDIRAVVGIVDTVLQRYIRGQLLLGVAIGVASFIFLVLFAVPYALVLAVLNGIFELVPIVGPWIGGIVAVIVTLAVAPEKTVLVIAFYVVLQQVENTLLVPKIQGDAVDINPALLIIALVIGGSVAGVWGLLAAVPFAAIAREVFDYLHGRFTIGPVRPTT